MALGKRRKKTAVNPPKKGGKARPKKANELLSSVIKESVIGAAINVMRENKPFVVSEYQWVVLLLPADNIGGLSMKQKNDESKGSIIELINADEITSLATVDMLENDIFGIIPTAHTLERMDEFELFVNAQYVWGMVTAVDGGTQLDINTFLYNDTPATFAEAMAISQGKMSLADIGVTTAPERRSAGDFSPGDAAENSAYMPDDTVIADPAEIIDDTESPIFEEEEGVPEYLIEEDDVPVFEEDIPDNPFGDVAEIVDSTEVTNDPFTVGDEITESNAPVDDYAGAAVERTVIDDGITVTREEVIDGLDRRYFSDDLEIKVSLNDFNMYFQPQEQPLQFALNEVSEDDWLGIQLNHLSERANGELAFLRKTHVDEARKLYLDLMSKHVENIVAELNTTDPESYYGALLAAAERDYELNLDERGEIVHKRREEIKQDFEAKVKAKREEAAAQAETRYREKYGAVLESQLRTASADFDAEAVEELRQSKSRILDLRRSEAHTRLDIGTNEVLATVQKRWEELYELEAKVLSEWQQYMADYLDEHRKEDVARIETLQRDLDNNNTIERMRIEFQTNMEQIRNEADAAIRQANDELNRSKAEAEAYLKQRETEWEFKERQNASDLKRSRKLSRKLMKELKTTQKLERQRYADKLEDMRLENEKLQFNSALERDNHARNNKMMIFFVVILVIMALAVGLVVGFAWFGSQASNTASLFDHAPSLGGVFTDYV